MAGLFWIVVCLLIGEALAAWTGLPVPGAVVGLALMLVALCVAGRVPESIDTAAAGLLRLLPLFVIPAGASVATHVGLLRADLAAIVVAILVSTLVAIWITGRIARRSQP